MALDNYSNLRAAVIRWTGNGELGEIFDDMLDLVEADIFDSGESLLRVKEMLVNDHTGFTPTLSRYSVLPDRFLGTKRLSIIANGQTCQLEQKDPVSMTISATGGRPRFYTVTNQFEFDRVSDVAYSLEHTFYQRPLALTTSTPTNAVLTRFPSIYLYGLLAAAYVSTGEVEQAAIYSDKMTSAIKQANKQDMRASRAPGSSMRILAPTP